MARRYITIKRRDGRSRHELYDTWRGIISRCRNPKDKDYDGYGANGIDICEEWASDFYRFVLDMGERPKGMTVDRINGRLGYSRDNCRWASAFVQSNNRIKRLSNSGVTGVCFVAARNNYLVEMQINDSLKRRRTKDFFEACCIRKSWEAEIKILC